MTEKHEHEWALAHSAIDSNETLHVTWGCSCGKVRPFRYARDRYHRPPTLQERQEEADEVARLVEDPATLRQLCGSDLDEAWGLNG